ncbi:MAG: L-seryl-tRNA(Sec) selenium transferase [Actinomycetota bacterium]|nr:L-seryl-tRNA(Sec) selenium transferase [Actinomycetota bacterium]
MLNRPPSVDALARSGHHTGLPHPLLVDVARDVIEAGHHEEFAVRVGELRRSMLQRVINATGVLLHTNLGRAPFAHTTEACYSNLELDLETGRRGSRSDHVGRLLARACGAEAGLVVNNGAGAVLLALAGLARGRGVAVSRGELVEIGGGFRIPDVIAQSGAQLVEVGTTNRTRVEDYAAVQGHVAVTLRVHRSNFRITGFTEQATTGEVAALETPLVVDLGSGLVDAACQWLDGGSPVWLADEPGVRQTLAAGASLVTFSGDKLFGGPQAGIIVGNAHLVAACARDPLYRALRPGQLILSALHEVALRYLDRTAGELPFWRMATAPIERLRARAAALDVGRVVDCDSVPGGGTLPGVTIASAGIELEGDHTAALRAAASRRVIARVHDGRTVLDLRTVDPTDDPAVADAVRDVVSDA